MNMPFIYVHNIKHDIWFKLIDESADPLVYGGLLGCILVKIIEHTNRGATPPYDRDQLLETLRYVRAQHMDCEDEFEDKRMILVRALEDGVPIVTQYRMQYTLQETIPQVYR